MTEPEQTIYERALQFVGDGFLVGLGSGRASTEFIKLLGERVRQGLRVRGVPTSRASATLATQLGIPLIDMAEALADGGNLDLAVDGADECDPHLDLIKGYGRALVREKIVAAASRQFVVLFGNSKDGKDVKDVPVLGTKGKLPVEVVPFAASLCSKRFRDLGFEPVLWQDNGQPALTDNGNYILDCKIPPISNAYDLEMKLLAIPGVVGTGLFLGMADIILVGDEHFKLVEERYRSK